MTVLEDWENGSTALDKYGGDTGEFDVQQTTVYEGSYAGHNGGSFSSENFIVDTGTTVQQGDTLVGWVQISDTSYGGGIVFGAQSETSAPDCYVIRLTSSVGIYKWSGGSSSQIASGSSSHGTGAWYQVEADWATDGTITATVYDSSGSQVGQVSTTDTDYTSGGWGWFAQYSNTDTYFDLYEANPNSGTVIDASATASGVATLTATAGVTADLAGGATVTASPSVVHLVDGAASVTGGSTLTATAKKRRAVAATVRGGATLTATARKLTAVGAHLNVFGTVAASAEEYMIDTAAGVGARGLVNASVETVSWVSATASLSGMATVGGTGEALLRPAMYAPTLTHAPGETTPTFAIDLYDDAAQPYDATAVDEARLTVTHEPTGTTLVDDELMAVESGSKAARATYSFGEGAAFELERVGGHTATVTVTTATDTQTVPAGGGLAIRAGDTPGYQQLSLDGAGIERGLAARETDRTSTMAAFDSADVTTADVDEAVLGTATTSGDFGVEQNFDVGGTSTLHGDVTLDAASLLGDDADLTLDTQPEISGTTSGVDPLHITDAAGTSVLQAHEGGGVDIGDFLEVGGPSTLHGDVTLDAATLVGDDADLSLGTQPQLTSTTSGVDPLHITDAAGTSVLEAHEGGGVNIGDFLEVGGPSTLHGDVTLDAAALLGDDAEFSLATQPQIASTTSGVDPLTVTDAAGTTVAEFLEGGNVGAPNGQLSEQGNRVATRNWTETADVTAGGSWTFNSNVSFGGNMLDAVSNIRPPSDSNLVFNLRDGTTTNRVTVYDNAAGNRVFVAWQNGDVEAPNGQLSEQGNRVATRTWTNNNADVPNADHADDATMWDGYERYISSSAPSTSNPYIRFEPK